MSAKTPVKTRVENPAALAGDTPEITPSPSEFSGTYRKLEHPKTPRAGDGCNYSLCIVPNDPRGNTHRCRCEPEYVIEDGEEIMTHPGFSWEGSLADFKAQFEKA